MMEPSLRPLLQRYPDARLGRLPLLDPILFPYLALMFGSTATAAVAAYNAVLIRRPALLARSLLLGFLGCGAFLLTVGIASRSGVESGSVMLILGRIVYFAIGGVLFFVHRPYTRGHQFLGGRTVPLLASYLVAIMLSLSLPDRLMLILLGMFNA